MNALISNTVGFLKRKFVKQSQQRDVVKKFIEQRDLKGDLINIDTVCISGLVYATGVSKDFFSLADPMKLYFGLMHHQNDDGVFDDFLWYVTKKMDNKRWEKFAKGKSEQELFDRIMELDLQSFLIEFDPDFPIVS